MSFYAAPLRGGINLWNGLFSRVFLIMVVLRNSCRSVKARKYLKNLKPVIVNY